ncbi:MAG: CotH kinase family protein [bacterium]
MKKYVVFSLLMILNFSTVKAQSEFTSSNLPIIIIDTQGAVISDEPKITAHMGIIDNGDGAINNVTDPFNDYDGLIGIEIRGSSTQMFPKKQYALETIGTDEKDSSASLLGMPKEADWILGSPYSDKTLLRDVLAYKLARDFDRYASRTRLCELVINNEYFGVYVLLEKIKQDNKRVDIKKMSEDDNSGDVVTGGYIVKIDKPEGSEYGGWYSAYAPYDDYPNKIFYQYHYPNEDDITQSQKNYIKGFIDQFEEVMASESYNDPFNGYYDIIDFDAFADYYLVNEFSKNVDAYRLSTYLHKDRDSGDPKLKLGPVWDFNHSFGNCDYDEAYNTTGWEVMYRNWSDYLTPFWFRNLFTDPVFYNNFIRRWNEVKNTLFNLTTINAFIDEKANYLSDAADRNFEKWPVLGTYVWPNYFVGNSYEEEIEYFKSWISDRWNWMNSFLPSTFASVEWTTHNETIPIKYNEENKFPFSYFYSITSNVDEIKFFANSEDAELTISNDTLIVLPHGTADFYIRAIAYKSSVPKVFSPLFKLSTGLNGAINSELVPEDFELYQNYPNPFNPTTVIGWEMPATSKVTLKIFDVLGREISTLVDREYSAGKYEVEFEAESIPSGIYFYRLRCGERVETKKMTLLR